MIAPTRARPSCIFAGHEMPPVKPSLQLAVAEEYPIVDAESRQLQGYINQFPDRDPIVIYEEETERVLKPELAGIAPLLDMDFHPDVESLGQALARQRAEVADLLDKVGCRMAIAGTHPDSMPQTRTRVFTWYSELVGEVAVVARRLQIYATTFHITIGDPDLTISVMNGMRYLLPHVLCLSTSSPLWSGELTGLKGYRQVLRDSLQRTNFPPRFASRNAYQEFLDTLIQSNSIGSSEAIRWDVRANRNCDGLIVSVCDAITKLDDLLTIGALLQGIAAFMASLTLNNQQFRTYDRILLMENKWRAMRYGTEGRLIDFGKETEVPLNRLMWELGELVLPFAETLNGTRYIERVHDLVEGGSSADRQIAVWQSSGESMQAVVDHIVSESTDL
ncbi:MAG: hypothetical protein F4Y80_03515 [Caldilineaceae bacterium SB0665_bin_21]|nr:hypothetical protein [Caldilineaceae bacterium SB0665_bin_21]MYA05939.1 hypothetical protein [Caldilineaceae bacterium SB0664_bin_22]MYC61662.1 hypothetical protein [Caldilineaceae bacterium SB0661_bin_34]